MDISALFSLKRCLCIKNDETLLVMCPPKIEVFSQTTGIYVEIIYNPRVQTLKVKIALKRCRWTKSGLKKRKKKRKKRERERKEV